MSCQPLLECEVELPGDVAPEVALDLLGRLAFGTATDDVGAGARVPGRASDADHVDRPVELAVAAAVEAVADSLAGGGGDGCCAGEHGEGCFAADAAVM
jgi:hypothetical protein